jgi:hypothetical protein
MALAFWNPKRNQANLKVSQEEEAEQVRGRVQRSLSGTAGERAGQV